MKTLVLILAALLANPTVSVFNFQRQPKQIKRSKEGWRRTKKDGWVKLDLPPDSKLRVGVTHRPKKCPEKTKSGDYLKIHYNGTLFRDDKDFDSSILRYAFLLCSA